MDYQNEIRTANSDPQKLEQLYLAAKNEGQSKSFQSAVQQIKLTDKSGDRNNGRKSVKLGPAG